MFCIHCGKNIEIDDKKCPYCGNIIESKIISKEIKNKYYTSIDDNLIKEYMGSKSDLFLNRKYSIGLFILLIIFNGAYLIYRKMYNLAIVWLVSSIGISLIPEVGNYVGIFNLIIALFFSLYFKELYLNQAKDKVNEIKQKNPTASSEELKHISKFKGGTNLLAAVIYLVINIVIVSHYFLQIYTSLRTLL